MKKPLLVAGAIAAVTVSTITGAGLVSAQADNNEPRDTFAERLSERFNLDPAEVEKFLDEERDYYYNEFRDHFEERLQKAVENGKLTQDQADKLLARMDETHEFLEGLRESNMTPEERRDALQAEWKELKQWLKDNEIPSYYLMHILPKLHVMHEGEVKLDQDGLKLDANLGFGAQAL